MIDWLRVLLFLVFLHATFSNDIPNNDTKHVGHGPPGWEIIPETNPRLMMSPLYVNCSLPVCEGPLQDIYCRGQIIATSWQLGMQEECPGEKLLQEPAQVLANFQKLTYPINATAFNAFCKENFLRINYMEPYSFDDWTRDPLLLLNISDPRRRKLAIEIHNRWNILGRRFRPDVMMNSSYYPVLTVPYPFALPGGMFDIYFYWDSFWIIEGLLLSGMKEASKGILRNFAHLVNTHGFIPNSGKLILSARTQPPLFAQMLHEYTLATGDDQLTAEILPAVEKELLFWEERRMRKVTRSGKQYNMFQYRASSNCPRPENFLIDYLQGMNSSRPAEYVWSSTASACESGWDFSSRWFSRAGQNAFDKRSIHTNDIIPVDVNVFMAWNYRSVALMHKRLNNTDKAIAFRKKFTALAQQVDALFWDDNDGIWYDYDMEVNDASRAFYPTNVYPFLVLRPSGEKINRVSAYLEKNGIFNFPGGIPSTLPVNSTQQWDFPNVWAPNLHLWVLSLLSTKDAFLVQKAKDAADKFIETAYNGMFDPPHGQVAGLWEKYDARKGDGTKGGGGEYPVQEGFGWTNGALVHLIMMFEQPGRQVLAYRALGWEDVQGLDDISLAIMHLGEFPNDALILFCVTVCLLLAIVYTVVSLMSMRRSREARRGGRRSDREGAGSLQRLLEESEEDE